MASRGEQEEFDAYLERRELSRQLIEVIAEARADLEALYGSSMADHEMRLGKERRLDELREELTALLEASGQKPPGWLSADLNNARLASVGIYQDRLPEFRALYEECEQDLQCFYERAEELSN